MIVSFTRSPHQNLAYIASTASRDGSTHSISISSLTWLLLAQDKQGADPNRVGGPTNHLLADGGLSTVIAGASNKMNTALTSSLQRLQSRSGGGSDRTLQAAFRAVGQMCEKLGLVRVIKDRACELYKQVRENRGGSGLHALCNLYSYKLVGVTAGVVVKEAGIVHGSTTPSDAV